MYIICQGYFAFWFGSFVPKTLSISLASSFAAYKIATSRIHNQLKMIISKIFNNKQPKNLTKRVKCKMKKRKMMLFRFAQISGDKTIMQEAQWLPSLISRIKCSIWLDPIKINSNYSVKDSNSMCRRRKEIKS